MQDPGQLLQHLSGQAADRLLGKGEPKLPATILALGNVFYHWGSVIIPPGFTDATVYAAGGNPYGTVATGGEGAGAAALGAARYQGQRLADFAARLRGDVFVPSRSAAA